MLRQGGVVKKHYMFRWILTSWMLLMASMPMALHAGELAVGSIAQSPSREVVKFKPFTDYLAANLKPYGIDGVKLVVADSIKEMGRLMREGKVDIYIDSPFPIVAVSRLAGSGFLLRRWKRGTGEYRSLIFVRKDSGIEGLEDLKGKVIAFEEPYSTTGYFMPKMMLVASGLRPAHLKDPFVKVPPGRVGYVFSYDDENTMVWVLRGRAAAGAMDEYHFETEAKAGLKDLKVLCKSRVLPRQVVSYRKGLEPEVVARIKAVLQEMDRREDGKKVLEGFEDTTMFDEPAGGIAKALAPLLEYGNYIDLEFGIR